MCLRLSHLFRLYRLYLLLAAALLGVAVVASPVPITNTGTSQRGSILLRIGDYDWEHSQWKRNSGTLRQSQWQWHKVLCISVISCFGYTPSGVIQQISPKTTQRSRRTQVHNDYYRTLKVDVNPSSFDRAQRSLFETFLSVTELQTAIGGHNMIKDDKSYIRAILNLMVAKDIVSGYDEQKSLKDNMKPVLQTPPRPLSLRFGVYDWAKKTWAAPKPASEPNFLCFSCYRVCLGFDKKESKVVKISPGWRSTPGGKGHIYTHRHWPLVFPFDQGKGDAWSDPDQKHRTLVQFLQDIGDLKKAASGGDITDPESYIRAILRYFSLDSVGIIQGYDSTKPLSDLVKISKPKNGQDVGDNGDGQGVGGSGDGMKVDNADHVQNTARPLKRPADGPNSASRKASKNGQEVGDNGGGQDVGDSGDGMKVDNSNHVQNTSPPPADRPNPASKSAAIQNLIG